MNDITRVTVMIERGEAMQVLTALNPREVLFNHNLNLDGTNNFALTVVGFKDVELVSPDG